MKNTSFLFGFAVSCICNPSNAQLLISGIIDGPLSGGTPKAIEIFVLEDVADLSIYTVQNYNNGGSTPGTTFALTGSANAGDFLYVASEAPQFTNFFGFAPDFTTGALNVNGDDAVLLNKNGVGIDVYGVIGQDGSGFAWDYLDGWAYRMGGSLPTATFDISDWIVSGVDGSEGGMTFSTINNPFPLASYTAGVIPEPSSFAAVFGVLALFGVATRRVRREA